MRRTSVVIAVATALVVALWVSTSAASATAPVAAPAPICTTAPADYPPSPQGCVPAGTPDPRPAAAANANRAGAGALARTGTDHLFDIVQVAALTLGGGALALYLRRRAEHRHALAQA